DQDAYGISWFFVERETPAPRAARRPAGRGPPVRHARAWRTGAGEGGVSRRGPHRLDRIDRFRSTVWRPNFRASSWPNGDDARGVDIWRRIHDRDLQRRQWRAPHTTPVSAARSPRARVWRGGAG